MKARSATEDALEGDWQGGEWGELTVTKVGRDSLVGSGPAGVMIHGVVVGHRADVWVVEGASRRSGYLYAQPNTDSLFVGLRDSAGRWDGFFVMTRSASSHPGG